MGRVLATFALILSFSGFPALAADDLITGTPVVALGQAHAGDVRLVAWELPNGSGIRAQALDSLTHESLGEVALGADPVAGNVHVRPAVAGLVDDDGNAVFFVAWHAEIRVDGNSAGTEVVGQRVVVDGITSEISTDPLLRVSRVDGDGNETAASESRSAPVVVAHAIEDEFLVLWTHWPSGRTLNADSSSHENYVIFGQEIGIDGEFMGDYETSIPLDSLEAPLNGDGLHDRPDSDVIFLAAVPLANETGYLLAWSDPSQEDKDEDGESEDLAQLHTKRLPASIVETDVDARIALGDSNSTSKGTGRIALASMPNGDGYLLAYEDTRGLSNIDGFVLDADGRTEDHAFHLLGPMQTGDTVFLSPQLISIAGEDRLLLYAAVGDHSIDGTSLPKDLPLEDGRLVRRVLDPDSLAFQGFGSDFETDVDAYPDVNIFFAAQAHASGALPESAGGVSFTAVANESRIIVSEFLFTADPAPPPPPSPPPPTSRNDEIDGGGGALSVLLFLLPFARSRRAGAALAGGLLLCSTANASPPDLELLFKEDNGASCYRSVMYREVSEIRIAKSWGKTPIPAGTPVEITDLPSGWRGEVIKEGKIQYVRLHPAPFDTVSGISIGRICMKFPAMSEEPQHISYVYDLVSSGSPIMANARPDDGVSNDELRATIKRGERLKQKDILDKPKQVEETVNAAKRLKDLFD